MTEPTATAGPDALHGLRTGWSRRRVSLVLQTEAAECGLACLAMVMICLTPSLIYFYSVYQLGAPPGNIDTGAVRQTQVRQHDVGATRMQPGHGLGDGRAALHPHARHGEQGRSQPILGGNVVFNNEDGFGARLRHEGQSKGGSLHPIWAPPRPGITSSCDCGRTRPVTKWPVVDTHRNTDMNKPYTQGAWFWMTPAVLGVILTGCGGGGSHSDAPTTPSTSATIAASLGRIYNAALEARCMATGTVLGSGSTGSSGLPTLTLSGTCSGPVVVELLANGATTYFDEKLGATAAMPAGTALRAIVPTFSAGSTLSIAITPLTEIAARQAITAAGSESAVTSVQASAANAAVLTQIFGAGVNFDILTPPTVVDSGAAANSLGTTAADRYAFYLAALAHLGSGSTPALAVASALATDLADGTLSGQSTAGLTYTSDGFATQRDTALTDAATAYASPALQTDLGIQPPAPVDVTGISPASGAVDDEITISGTGFDTDPYHLEVKFYNNVAAEVVSATATAIVVRVPSGAATWSCPSASRTRGRPRGR